MTIYTWRDRPCQYIVLLQDYIWVVQDELGNDIYIFADEWIPYWTKWTWRDIIPM